MDMSIHLESKEQTLVAEIPLSGGFVAIVDAADADLVRFKWSASGSRSGQYAIRITQSNRQQKTHRLHRVIMERVLGRPLESAEEVDHRDGNTLNNRRSNLRLATHAQNMRNSKRNIKNTSGYKGVSYFKRDNNWRARIGVDGKRIHLGYFDTPEEAYETYKEAAHKYHGEFARLGGESDSDGDVQIITYERGGK